MALLGIQNFNKNTRRSNSHFREKKKIQKFYFGEETFLSVYFYIQNSITYESGIRENSRLIKVTVHKLEIKTLPITHKVQTNFLTSIKKVIIFYSLFQHERHHLKTSFKFKY